MSKVNYRTSVRLQRDTYIDSLVCFRLDVQCYNFDLPLCDLPHVYYPKNVQDC
jgi:hypothetical protein